MRVLSHNIFEKYLEKIKAENSHPVDNAMNMFDRNYLSVGKFLRNRVGKIELTSIDEVVNSFCIFNTNVNFIEIEIETFENETKNYASYINEKVQIINIETVRVKNIVVSFFASDDQDIFCEYLTCGLGLDFPPHSPKKTHTLNFTHEAFFSESGHYFSRHLPMKKYDTWVIAFELLTNNDKNKIIDFFDATQFQPFALQIWTHLPYKSSCKTNVIADFNSSFSSGLSILFGSEFGKINNIKNEIYYKLKYENKQKNIRHEMKSGFYVCTNNKIDFKKTKNNIYPWSTSLTLRLVK